MLGARVAPSAPVPSPHRRGASFSRQRLAATCLFHLLVSLSQTLLMMMMAIVSPRPREKCRECSVAIEMRRAILRTAKSLYLAIKRLHFIFSFHRAPRNE